MSASAASPSPPSSRRPPSTGGLSGAGRARCVVGFCCSPLGAAARPVEVLEPAALVVLVVVPLVVSGDVVRASVPAGAAGAGRVAGARVEARSR